MLLRRYDTTQGLGAATPAIANNSDDDVGRVVRRPHMGVDQAAIMALSLASAAERMWWLQLIKTTYHDALNRNADSDAAFGLIGVAHREFGVYETLVSPAGNASQPQRWRRPSKGLMVENYRGTTDCLRHRHPQTMICAVGFPHMVESPGHVVSECGSRSAAGHPTWHGRALGSLVQI